MLRKILFPLRWLAVRLIDGVFLFSAAWIRQTMAAIQRVNERCDRQDMENQLLREKHAREEERLKDELKIAAINVRLLTASNDKFFEMHERDRALLNLQIELAKAQAVNGRPGSAGLNPYPGQY